MLAERTGLEPATPGMTGPKYIKIKLLFVNVSSQFPF